VNKKSSLPHFRSVILLLKYKNYSAAKRRNKNESIKCTSPVVCTQILNHVFSYLLRKTFYRYETTLRTRISHAQSYIKYRRCKRLFKIFILRSLKHSFSYNLLLQIASENGKQCENDKKGGESKHE
jgi:predicted nucleic acid-binding protein